MPVTVFGQLVDNRQAEPKAAVAPGDRAIGLPETIEDMRQKRRVDAAAGVANDQLPVTLTGNDRHVDGAPRRRELHGIGQQVR